MTNARFKVWRTIKLGTGLKTANNFRKALKGSGFNISDWVNDILSKRAFADSVSPIPIEVDLCIATKADLTGKKECGTTAEVFDGIRRLGGELCSDEVGPQLRLQYRDQPKNERLLIAMEVITDDYDGDRSVFCVGHTGGVGLWIDVSGGCGPNDFWSGDNRWVFRCK